MPLESIAEKIQHSGGNNSAFKNSLKKIINSTNSDIKNLFEYKDIVKEIERKMSFSFSKIESEISDNQEIKRLYDFLKIWIKI